jgi:hypothetical protein
MLMPIVLNQKDPTFKGEEKRRARTGQMFCYPDKTIVRWYVHVTQRYWSSIPVSMPAVAIHKVPSIVKMS